MSSRLSNSVTFSMETRSFWPIGKRRRRGLNWGRASSSLIGWLAGARESRGGSVWLVCQPVWSTYSLRNSGCSIWSFYSFKRVLHRRQQRSGLLRDIQVCSSSYLVFGFSLKSRVQKNKLHNWIWCAHARKFWLLYLLQFSSLKLLVWSFIKVRGEG